MSECLHLLPVFHDSEPGRESTYTWRVEAVVSHDSSAQQMSTSNRARVCVCVCCPLPLLSTAAPSSSIRHATDLVARVTSCVDGFTSVLITTQQ